MSKGNQFFTFFLFALCVFVCQQSITMGVGTLNHPGSGFLPLWAGTTTGLLLLALGVGSRRFKTGSIQVAHDAGNVGRKRVLFTSALLFAYTIGVTSLGFATSTFLFTLILLWIIERSARWTLFLKAAAITAGTHFVFVIWLGLPLPTGVFI
jgi:hypothetical protein